MRQHKRESFLLHAPALNLLPAAATATAAAAAAARKTDLCFAQWGSVIVFENLVSPRFPGNWPTRIDRPLVHKRDPYPDLDDDEEYDYEDTGDNGDKIRTGCQLLTCRSIYCLGTFTAKGVMHRAREERINKMA